MNRLITLRPLASAAVLAVAAMSAAPALAALPHASASSLSRVSQQALAVPASLHGTVLALNRARLTAELAVSDGTLYSLRFNSAAQQRGLRAGSVLTVSGVNNRVHLVVRSLRINGFSARTHLQGTVARRLGRTAVELLGTGGAAVSLSLSHAHIARVLHRAGRLVRTAAAVVPGDRLYTTVALAGSGDVATGTATAVAPPPPPAPSSMQIEVGGIITAVDPAAGTITVNDDDGFTSVVAVSAAGSYSVGQDVDVVGTPTGPGGSATSVQAQYVTREAPEAAEPYEGAEAPEPPEYNAPEPPEPPDYD
jgi:hypothetical protein